MSKHINYRGPLLCVIIYILFSGAYLNFNNVIIKKDFQCGFEYYGSPLHKEVNS